MFSKLFSILKVFVLVDIKLITVVVLLLMSSSIDSEANQSICSFLIKEGRVRDLGLYQFINRTRKISHRLFSREWDGILGSGNVKMAEEYRLEFGTNGSVWALPPPELEVFGLQKFYGGYHNFNYKYTQSTSDYNCWQPEWVCLL